MSRISDFNKMKSAIGNAKSSIGTSAGEVLERLHGVTSRVGSTAEETKEKKGLRTKAKKAPRKPSLYDQAILDYNNAVTAVSDAGRQLHGQRERTVDLISLIESLVNSIARTPKTFDTDFDEIKGHKKDFSSILVKYDEEHLATIRKSAAGAGAGVVASVGVAAIAPTTAMWVATTFGTASTGTAISSLSGAAATNAALAWLGGGSLATGGGGMYAGTAFLALAGPVGWSIAGATILTSVVVVTAKKLKTRKEKEKVLSDIKRNTARLEEVTAKVSTLLRNTTNLRERLIASFEDVLGLSGHDYADLSPNEQSQLASLVNKAKSSAALLNERFEEGPEDG